MARNLAGDAVGPGPDRRARQLALLIVGGLVLALVVLGIVAWRAVRPGDPDLPRAQQHLVEGVQRAQQHGTGTPVAQVQARRDRRTWLCGDRTVATSADRLVEAWVGTIQDIDTPLGGDDGTFRIDLGDHLSLVQDTKTPGGGVRRVAPSTEPSPSSTTGTACGSAAPCWPTARTASPSAAPACAAAC